MATLFFSLIALSIIFVIVNLLENLDEFLDQNASISVIANYYLNFLPEIIKLITPIAVLLSTLFTVGNMSVNNEITAMKSSGISLYQLMIPYLILSVIISLCQLYFNGWIVPAANERKNEIESVYLNQTATGGPIFNLFFRDSPTRNVVINYYNSDMREGTQVSIEYFTDNVAPRIVKRIEAEKIIWDSLYSRWKLIRGISREFLPNKIDALVFDTLVSQINITHNQIISLKRSITEMNFDELADYINLLERGGKDVRMQRIEYHGQYAFPFANFIVMLFGVPFASIRKKGGIAIQIGAAMIISFFYLIFTKLGQSVGAAFDFDPIISGWLANIVFFIIGLFTLVKTRT